MSNYLKKFTENTSFGTTEQCKYCGLITIWQFHAQFYNSCITRNLVSEYTRTIKNLVFWCFWYSDSHCIIKLVIYLIYKDREVSVTCISASAVERKSYGQSGFFTLLNPDQNRTPERFPGNRTHDGFWKRFFFRFKDLFSNVNTIFT